MHPGAADPRHLVVMRCLNPAPLHHQLGLAVLLACGKPSQNIAYMQGLGHVADIIRVWGWAWVMLQRGLVCIIKTSFQKASQPKKHCFLEGIGRIQARLTFAHFGAKRCRACRRCWVLALRNAVNTAKNCCAERWAGFAFAVAGSRAARSLLFSRLFSGLLARARARPQPHNTAIYGVLLHSRFRPGLRAALFGLLFWGPLARAHTRPHVSLLGWGPDGAQKAGIPGIIWG